MASEFLPFAHDSTANVVTQAEWLSHPDRPRGFQAGVAPSAPFNKVWRQAVNMVAAISQFIDQRVTGDVVDDGNVANLATQFAEAVAATGGGGPGGGINDAPIDGRMFGRINAAWSPIEDMNLDGGTW